MCVREGGVEAKLKLLEKNEQRAYQYCEGLGSSS